MYNFYCFFPVTHRITTVHDNLISLSSPVGIIRGRRLVLAKISLINFADWILKACHCLTNMVWDCVLFVEYILSQINLHLL